MKTFVLTTPQSNVIKSLIQSSILLVLASKAAGCRMWTIIYLLVSQMTFIVTWLWAWLWLWFGVTKIFKQYSRSSAINWKAGPRRKPHNTFVGKVGSYETSFIAESKNISRFSNNVEVLYEQTPHICTNNFIAQQVLELTVES